MLINGASQVTVDHNTAIVDGTSAVFADVNAVSGFVFTNNLLIDNGLGLKGSGSGPGTATIARYFPGAHVAGNVIAGANAALYPGGTYYPPISGVGFADAANGNYRLSPGSPYKHGGTDGSDPGCNFDALTGMGGTVPPLGLALQLPAGEAPASPRGLAARVTGSTVTLTWNASQGGGAASYVLEAGTAPGMSNAARANVGAVTSLVVHAVPANTYYVRIVAVNGAAVSAPSDEIVVVVR